MFEPGGPTFLELMHQALVSTERGYDLIAPKFDRTPFRTPDPIVIAMAKAIGGPGSIGSALDICCGTGAVLRHLRPLCTDRVVGFDFSRGMLDEAERYLASVPEAERGTAKVELVHGDALALPFDREMDVVASAGAFGHILPENEDRFVEGITRALVPGGRFVFATAPVPHATESWFWLAHGFNAVMRVRNAILRPPFIMYYLTFAWPNVRPLLERHGLIVEAHHGLFPAPYGRIVIVTATRPGA